MIIIIVVLSGLLGIYVACKNSLLPDHEYDEVRINNFAWPWTEYTFHFILIYYFTFNISLLLTIYILIKKIKL